MLSSSRVVWNDNGTLKDVSTVLNNFFSGTKVMDIVADEDYLYLGSDVPFNHRYIDVAVANASASVPTVEIWDGGAWVEAVDVIDFTQATEGKSLGQSGILAWSTDKNKSWGKESSTENMTGSGLETLKIYNMYWVRVSFDGDMDDTTAIKYVGHKFSEDEDLGGYYPDLNRSAALAAFASGKTSWKEQHIMAAEEIFLWLRSKRELWAKSQIFGWEAYRVAACHKVAQIAYAAYGSDYTERMATAMDRFDEIMEGTMPQQIDRDEDGHIDETEQAGLSVGMFRR